MNQERRGRGCASQSQFHPCGTLGTAVLFSGKKWVGLKWGWMCYVINTPPLRGSIRSKACVPFKSQANTGIKNVLKGGGGTVEYPGHSPMQSRCEKAMWCGFVFVPFLKYILTNIWKL
jgi:hypothetical protein